MIRGSLSVNDTSRAWTHEIASVAVAFVGLGKPRDVSFMLSTMPAPRSANAKAAKPRAAKTRASKKRVGAAAAGLKRVYKIFANKAKALAIEKLNATAIADIHACELNKKAEHARACLLIPLARDQLLFLMRDVGGAPRDIGILFGLNDSTLATLLSRSAPLYRAESEVEWRSRAEKTRAVFQKMVTSLKLHAKGIFEVLLFPIETERASQSHLT